MGRYWSLLFLAVPVFGVAVFLWGPSHGFWLARDVSEHGHKIDHLFKFILGLTGLVFLITEATLFWFIWKYDAKSHEGRARFTHGSHNLEIVWTIVPAATLLFIAIYQMNAWAEVKINRPDMPPTVEVVARQFEWRLRYPYTKPDGWKDGDPYVFGKDDIYHVNDLHLPVNQDILVHLKSQDVLHDFFLPNLRIKQDAVPGMTIPVWFRAMEVGEFDLVCAELCGWGHYKMKGRVTIESREEYEAWLKKMAQQQNTTK